MSDLVSLVRLARHVKLPKDWLKEKANSGDIPCLKVGGKYLFSLSAVQDALAAKAARGSGEVDQ